MKRIILVVLCFLLMVGSSSASTRYVNTTGWWLDGGAFNTSATPITGAIAASSSFDTVYVYNGSYTETPVITISNLTMKGESSSLVNLSGGFIINSGVNHVNISGFNITGSPTYGIHTWGDYANISYNKIKASGGYTGLCVDGNYNDFLNNVLVGSDFGIVNNCELSGGPGADYNEYINNTISGSVYEGILLLGGVYTVVNGGTIDTSGDYDYDCSGGCGYVNNFGTLSGYNNNGVYFKNTNFSVGQTRKIYLDSNSMIFNVSENGITIIVSRNIVYASYPVIFDRTMYSLNQTNVTFKDSGAPDSWGRGYRLYGLLPDSYYSYYKNDVFQSTLTTNSVGDLSYFSNTDISDAVIKIIEKKFVYTLAATDVIAGEATLHGMTANLSVPATVWFEWSGSPSTYKYKTANQTITEDGTFSATLSGMPLISNSKYYFRAVANDGTNTFYGDQMSFTTLALGQIPDNNFDAHFDELIAAELNPTNMSAVATLPFTDIFGNVFWGILFAALFIFIWMRSEDVTIPSILGLIIGGSLWALMPADWTSMAMSLTVVSFGGIMYSLIRGRS